MLGGVFHAATLFLVAAGLQLVFGVQKIVNLACGSFYALGAYFVIAAYKAAVERAAKAIGGKWPSTDQIIQALEGIEVESLSGMRSYRKDHIMEANFYQGLTTYKNQYDFVTIDPVEVMSTKQIQKPSGMGLYDWINSWKV